MSKKAVALTVRGLPDDGWHRLPKPVPQVKAEPVTPAPLDPAGCELADESYRGDTHLEFRRLRSDDIERVLKCKGRDCRYDDHLRRVGGSYSYTPKVEMDFDIYAHTHFRWD